MPAPPLSGDAATIPESLGGSSRSIASRTSVSTISTTPPTLSAASQLLASAVPVALLARVEPAAFGPSAALADRLATVDFAQRTRLQSLLLQDTLLCALNGEKISERTDRLNRTRQAEEDEEEGTGKGSAAVTKAPSQPRLDRQAGQADWPCSSAKALLGTALQRALLPVFSSSGNRKTSGWLEGLKSCVPLIIQNAADFGHILKLLNSLDSLALHETAAALATVLVATANDAYDQSITAKLTAAEGQSFETIIKDLSGSAIQELLLYCSKNPLAPELDAHLRECIEYIAPDQTASFDAAVQEASDRNFLDSGSPIMAEDAYVFFLMNSDPSNMLLTHGCRMSVSKSVAALLVKAGYNVLASADVFTRALIAHVGSARGIQPAFKETLLARALGTICMTHADLPDPVQGPWSSVINESKLSKSTWDIDVFISVVQQYAPNTNWTTVMSALDYPEFAVRDLRGFEILMEGFHKGSKAKKFPIQVMFNPWKNVHAQYTLLAQAVSAPPDVFNFADYTVNETRKIVNPEELAIAASGSSRTPITSLPNQALNSLDVLATLVHLLNFPGVADDVTQFLHNASAQAPELLLLGLAQLPTPWTPVHMERVGQLTKEFLMGRPTSSFVLPRLWNLNSSEMMTRMVELQRDDPTSLGRLLDVCQEVKCLARVLKKTPFPFALELAALAGRREYLNLEKWLSQMVVEHGEAFARACINFVQSKLHGPKSATSLSMDVASTVVKTLEAHIPNLGGRGSDLADALAALNLNNPSGGSGPGVGAGAGNSAAAGDPRSHYIREIEEQSIHLFDLFYNGEMQLGDMVAQIKAYKEMNDKQSQDIYMYIVTTLLEETKFFSNYPERNLHLSAMLMGQLIANNLLPPNALERALSFLLEALAEAETSKIFHFGFRALGQFLHRIGDFSQFATRLTSIPALVANAPEVIELVQQKVPQRPFRALFVDEALACGCSLTAPSRTVQDKVLFLINNLSPTNVEIKVKDFAEVLPETYFRWFAEYLVTVRAAIEPNFHSLYLQFLKFMESPKLFKCVLHETYALANEVLNSDRTVESSTERTKLKNIGSWLGSLTLARNYPIKHKHLSVKDLLLEGYHHARLMVVVPFVCKILEQAKHSSVFLPPNPWLMAALSLLVELYHYADIKLNLKFEIEVLCKNLSIELVDIRPSALLQERRVGMFGEAPETMNLQGQLPPQPVPSRSADVAVSGPGTVAAARPGYGPPPPQMDYAHVTLANLSSFIVLNPSLPLVDVQPGLKRLVHLALDRAIREILAPVVERSVTIAAISTRELVLKDFAMEPDERKIRKAAQAMAQNLASSLAQVTCKEPLRLSMTTHLRTLLLQNGLTDQVVSEQLLLLTVADNLDIGSHIIEQAAMDKAPSEMDEQLANILLKRKQMREMGKPFFDPTMTTAAKFRAKLATLPEPLRLKMGGLSPVQIGVYDEFYTDGKAPFKTHAAGDTAMYMDRPGAPAGRQGGEDMTLQHAIERFTMVMGDLEKALSNVPPFTRLNDVPPTHEVYMLMRQIVPIVASLGNGGRRGASNSSRDDLTLMFCSKVIQPLYASNSDTAREAYAYVLRELCEQSTRVGREVVQWLLYAEDERKYNVPATCVLVRVGLLLVSDIDLQLARAIELGKNLVDFAMELINMSGAQGIASDTDWFNTVDVLNRLVLTQKAPENVKDFIVAMRHRVKFQNQPSNGNARTIGGEDDEMVQLKEQLAYTFAEWVCLYQHPNANEHMFAAFIAEMHKYAIFSSDDTFCLFFRICTELSVDAYFKASKTTPSAAVAYQAIDAFAKLVVLLTKYHEDQAPGSPGSANRAGGSKDGAIEMNGTAQSKEETNGHDGLRSPKQDDDADGATSARISNRLAFFTKTLSIVVLVLVHAHETKQLAFNQRPYFRLFSSLLHEMNAQEQALQHLYLHMLKAFCNTLHAVQPALIPGFTFAWLALVAHRQFMPKVLLLEGHLGWPLFSRLLLDLFRFLVPFLRDKGGMGESTRILYRGTLRVLLVLLHDFPEFLCDHYYTLCSVIPPSCLQLRNLVLSAFPRSMRLPDPFTPNLRMDTLLEVKTVPSVEIESLKDLVHSFGLSSGHWDAVVAASKLRLGDVSKRDDVTGSNYNVALINAIVLLAGHQDIIKNEAAADSPTSSAAASPKGRLSNMSFFRDLLEQLDSEGRYHVVSAIANHLRYPNAHTEYFSELLLHLFLQKEAGHSSDASTIVSRSGSPSSNGLQEQITRVLLERLIVNRPHPWGLLVTFIELIKDPQYAFWTYGFTRCAPDIERLFESVSRSVNVH